MVDRIISKEIKSTLIKGWRPTGTVSFKVAGENLFLLEFEHFGDKARVLEGRPWVLEGCLFSVEEFDGLTPPTQMGFERAAFWVRMFNLPLASMGRAIK